MRRGVLSLLLLAVLLAGTGSVGAQESESTADRIDEVLQVLQRMDTVLAEMRERLPAGAESAPAQETMAPAGGSTQALRLWERIHGMLTEMAKQFPEEKYDFKPTPEVRSFRKQLMHVAGANYFFIRLAGGEKTKPEHAARENKADVVAVLEESFTDGAALIRQIGDAGMNKPIQHPFRDHKVPLHTIWIVAVGHAAEHYGQLVLYYRLNGLVPPATLADQARRQQQERQPSQPQ